MTEGARSSDLSEIAVNANNIPDDSVDCGIIRLNWCRGPTCQKFARLRTFVVVLAYAGLLQGAAESYFRISAKQAALEYGYNPLIVDWLLVSSGIFQAIFAIVFAYWAHKMHPMNWLSGTIMLQAAVAIIAVIPAISSYSDNTGAATNNGTSVTDTHICTTSVAQFQRSTQEPSDHQIGTLVLLFVLQFALAMGSLAYYTVGLTYIDDNSRSLDSPAVLATAFGAKVCGLALGSMLVLLVGATPIGWWLGWVIIAPLLFASGVCLSLFPKRLPKTVIHQAAQRIIEESRSRNFGSQFSTYIDDPDLWPSVKRIFGNKLLVFNLLSAMFIQSAWINYTLQEETYLQSRFYLPFNEEDGLTQEWQARFVSYFLKPPVAAICMLVFGLIVSKMELSAQRIAGINIACGIKLLSTYIAFIFIQCDVGPIAGVSGGKLQQPFCSRQCICTPTTFFPVCPENATVTYFSPCYAGCSSKTTINKVEIYDGCSCGSNYEMNIPATMRATEGACSAESCFSKLIGFEILTLMAVGILGVTAIGQLLITLRSVLPQDKGLALAAEVMLVGLFAYIPANLAYQVVTRVTCLYWAPGYKRCLLRETPKQGNIINILSASLTLIGIIFNVLVYIYIKGLNLYNCKVTDVNYTPSLYAPIPHSEDETPSTTAPIAPAGGSPVTQSTNTTGSPTSQVRPTIKPKLKPARTAPKPEINVFRNPSSLTNSSAGEQSLDANSGVTYAQIVFPPDKRKPKDGSPKRMAVRADVPVQHLTTQDVRAQLNNLKSFNPAAAAAVAKAVEAEKPVEANGTLTAKTVTTPLLLNESTPHPEQTNPDASRALSVQTAAPATPVATNSSVVVRPLSPETDL